MGDGFGGGRPWRAKPKYAAGVFGDFFFAVLHAKRAEVENIDRPIRADLHIHRPLQRVSGIPAKQVGRQTARERACLENGPKKT